jgi:hypothetical protein
MVELTNLKMIDKRKDPEFKLWIAKAIKRQPKLVKVWRST